MIDRLPDPEPDDDDALDELAACAGRVLAKFGSGHPDWTEWRDLAEALLAARGSLSHEAALLVSDRCRAFLSLSEGEPGEASP